MVFNPISKIISLQKVTHQPSKAPSSQSIPSRVAAPPSQPLEPETRITVEGPPNQFLLLFLLLAVRTCTALPLMLLVLGLGMELVAAVVAACITATRTTLHALELAMALLSIAMLCSEATETFVQRLSTYINYCCNIFNDLSHLLLAFNGHCYTNVHYIHLT
jgi:hypothetical protein